MRGIIMRLTICVLMLCTIAMSQQSSQTIYIDEHPDSSQWCALQDSNSSDADIQNTRSLVVASANYISGRLSVIDINKEADSGDWIMFDHYVIDRSGNMVSLKRVFNSATDDASMIEIADFVSGKLILRSQTYKSLSAGAPLGSKDLTWIPKITIYPSIKKLPFARLLPLHGPLALKGRIRCISSAP